MKKYILVADFEKEDGDLEQYTHINQDKKLLEDEEIAVKVEPELYSNHDLLGVEIYELLPLNEMVK